MGVLKEFREFAVRGNVIDLAIGVVIGTAFGKIVSSLVGDIISPLLGRLVGGVSFVDWQVSLGRIPGSDAELMLRWGAFLQTLFDFMIIALALFIAIKGLNRLRTLGAGKADGAPTSADEVSQAPAVPAAAPPAPVPAPATAPAAASAAEAIESSGATVELLTEIRDLLKQQQTRPG